MESLLKRLARAFVSNIIGIYVAQLFVSGFLVDTSRYEPIIFASIILLLVHLLIKPLLKLISFPVNVVTLGFFELIINSLLLYLVVALVDGVNVVPGIIDLGYLGIIVESIQTSKFGTLFASSVTISIINWLLKLLLF